MKLLLIGFLIGGLTNVLVEIHRNDGLILPRKLKTKIKFGFIYDLFIGGIAGALFVAFIDPETLLKTFLIATIGGFGGVGTLERIAGYNGIYKDNAQLTVIDAKSEKLDGSKELSKQGK